MKKAVLYLRVSQGIKDWLIDLCKKEVGHINQSAMAERILVAAREQSETTPVRKRKKNGTNQI